MLGCHVHIHFTSFSHIPGRRTEERVGGSSGWQAVVVCLRLQLCSWGCMVLLPAARWGERLAEYMWLCTEMGGDCRAEHTHCT